MPAAFQSLWNICLPRIVVIWLLVIWSSAPFQFKAIIIFNSNKQTKRLLTGKEVLEIGEIKGGSI